jgi:hypothetical protein
VELVETPILKLVAAPVPVVPAAITRSVVNFDRSRATAAPPVVGVLMLMFKLAVFEAALPVTNAMVTAPLAMLCVVTALVPVNTLLKSCKSEVVTPVVLDAAVVGVLP